MPLQTKGKPHFLLCNDDGFRAPGIQELAQRLRAHGEVTLVAPDGARSGYSSAITTTLPLRLRLRHEEDGYRVYSVEGTPVDCVKLALATLFAEGLPDLVVSGINHGSNEAICVHYSGTIGAAREACIAGAQALALSLDDTHERPDFAHALDYSVRIALWQIEHRQPSGVFLSLNVPKGEPRGLKVCPQGVSRFVDEWMPSTNARGHQIYWMQGYQAQPEPSAVKTDIEWLREGYATLTPLMLDQTAHGELQALEAELSSKA